LAEERTITTVFKADISNFSASTQQLNRYVAQVNSEFKNATASMGRWNDNADGLRAKITQLNGVYDAEKKKLKALEDAYNELTDEQKKNTAQGQKLATAINEQSAKVKETKKNIDYYTDSLKELDDAGVNTKAELEDVNKELEDQKQALKDLGGGLLKGAAIGIAGIGAACVGALAGLNSLVEDTKELRTQMGQIETTFTEAGHSVEASKKTYGDLFAVLGDSGKATEASMHMAQMAKSEQELAEMSNILTGVYATFGDSLPVEGLAEAMNHTAKLGSVQGVLADALEWAGVNVDGFNEQLAGLNTEEERAQLINSTLNGIYGETAEKYKEVNKDVIAANDAQNKYNQAMAGLAEKAQPAITSFKTAMAEMLTAVLAKFEDVDIEGIVSDIADVIIESVTWILDNKDFLLAAITGIGAAFLTWKVASMIQTVVKGIKALTLATEGQTIAQRILNGVMKANPIGLVVTAVGLLVAAFVTLWNKCEGFRNFFLNMWEGIKTVAKGAAEFIGNIFKGIINTVKGIVNGVISLINGAIGAINKISVKIPNWVPEWGGKTIGFNLKKIPTLAEGGVVDKATLAMIGEAGKEVVMPLENNTQWIDKLADKISARTGNKNITYNVSNKFERMETTQHALHKANLEFKRTLRGATL
jgi:phage-related protein